LVAQFQRVLEEWTDIENVDVILTSGGTGFGSRDVTPEATREVIHRETSGMTIAMFKKSLDITPLAMLSR
jgi:gephyrin